MSKWFIGVVVIGVGINLLTGLAVTREWGWLPLAVFVAALLVAVSNSVFCARSVMAQLWLTAWPLLALTGYLVIVIWRSMTGWPVPVMILSLAYFWETGVMLMWSTLRSRAGLDHVAVGTVCLLVGSAFFLLGIMHPPDTSTLDMVEGLVRVAFLLLGAGALLGGVVLLYSPELPRRLVAWLAKQDALPLTADDN